MSRGAVLAVLAVFAALLALYVAGYGRAPSWPLEVGAVQWCQSRYATARTAVDTAIIDRQRLQSPRQPAGGVDCGALRRGGRLRVARERRAT